MSGSGSLLDTVPVATELGQVVRTVGPVNVAPGPGGAGTSAVTRVPTAIINTTLLAANADRIGATFQNNSVTNLFLKLGATAGIGAGTESFTVRIVPNAYYEVPFGYTGIIDGIWDGADATGEVLVTELTA